MKIYHTETKEDYDALMVELEAKGCKWASGRKPTSPDYWKQYGEKTGIEVEGSGTLSKGVIEYLEEVNPQAEVIKYKAKADEKMRFTKENVYKVFSQYRKDGNYTLNDLQDEILKLDDTPEKVVVPKCFDEWFKEIKATYSQPDSAETFALWKLCRQGFGHGYEDVHGKKIPYETDLGEWLFKNKMLAIDAVLNGYTIEPEQLYYIPLPDLETSDGIQQVLSKRDTYFASRPSEKLKQRFTKAELEQVPEIYKPYAKPIEEEEE